jgi:hypothetical protein
VVHALGPVPRPDEPTPPPHYPTVYPYSPLASCATISVMVAEDPSAECFVCRKHQTRGPLMPGGLVGEDDLVVVSHLPPGSSGRPVYLGHLFVEPWRHAPGLGDLTELEARAVGWWCTRASPPAAKSEIAGGCSLVR